jgi:hypothetical protein
VEHKRISRNRAFYSTGTFLHPQDITRLTRTYRHYDVTPAPTTNWNTPPFTLTSLNGYLYGRGVTDNKGPILAVACAASELLARRELDLDLVVLVEGEEEAGSEGFVDGVRKYKVCAIYTRHICSGP